MAMSTASTFHDNFIRCHEGLQLVCSAALPCVQAVIEAWHWKNQQNLKPCQTPNVCPSYKKPTSKHGACQCCIDWGVAVESVYYDPSKGGGSLVWKNVSATKFHSDPVEVAKAFVFQLSSFGKREKFSDFDSGSILKLMISFEQFHHGDVSIIEAVEKVSDFFFLFLFSLRHT